MRIATTNTVATQLSAIAEHHNRTAAENCLRQSVKNCPYKGEKTGKNHNTGTGGNSLSVDNFCHSNKSHILAEGCNWHATQKAGKSADKTITGKGTGNFPVCDFSVKPCHAKSRGISNRLRCRYEKNQANGDDGTEMKFRSKWKIPK